MKPLHLEGQTFHKRLGSTKNAFRYGVDYLLLEPDDITDAPRLFSHNRRNLMAFYDVDNGGQRKAGRGSAWVREILCAEGMEALASLRILLLTQPRRLGFVFNPVSFWLMLDSENALRGVIAEVNNTFGDRHSYICAHEDGRAITSSDILTARKLFYVSPFQPTKGDYSFRFTVTDTHIGIRIDLRHGEGGMVATLNGKLAPLGSIGILKIVAMRPFGALRVIALIFYQALKLRLKGVRYRGHEQPQIAEVSK